MARGIPVGVLSLGSPQLASSKEGAWKLQLQRTEFDQQSHELESRFQELPLRATSTEPLSGCGNTINIETNGVCLDFEAMSSVRVDLDL